MSRIATATELQGVLEDYKIHLTGDASSSEAPDSRSATISNPPHWPTDHRRVPDYRPVDKNRDAEGRPNGENAFERVFLTIMFTGVVMNAVSEDANGKDTKTVLIIVPRLLQRFGEPQLGHTSRAYSDMQSGENGDGLWREILKSRQRRDSWLLDNIYIQ
jgi:hypothetical protein